MPEPPGVPNNHLSCPPPILVEEPIEPFPYFLQPEPQTLANFSLVGKFLQPGLDAFEADNVSWKSLQRRGIGWGEKLSGEEVERRVVKAVGFVAVQVSFGCVRVGVQRGLARQCAGVKGWGDEV